MYSKVVQRNNELVLGSWSLAGPIRVCLFPHYMRFYSRGHPYPLPLCTTVSIHLACPPQCFPWLRFYAHGGSSRHCHGVRGALCLVHCSAAAHRHHQPHSTPVLGSQRKVTLARQPDRKST